MPLTLASGGRPVGVLVLGISPYRRLDEEYRSFLALSRADRRRVDRLPAFEAQRARVQVLADLDLVKMEFFQNVSHELRTPLTLLLAPLQDLLRRRRPVTTKRARTSTRRSGCADRLRGWSMRCWTSPRPRQAASPPDCRPTDLCRVDSRAASMFRSTAEHAGLRLDVACRLSRSSRMVDRRDVVDHPDEPGANAVKFTEHGGIPVPVARGG